MNIKHIIILLCTFLTACSPSEPPVTVTCQNKQVGKTFSIGEYNYLVVDNQSIRDRSNLQTLADGEIRFCTSQVTDMGGIFVEATAFNQDIGQWDVSNVTSMSYMFHGATAFSQDLTSWNVKQVRGPSQFSNHSGLQPEQLPKF